MEKNTEMMSLTDVLRNGTSPEDIRKFFESALKDAQNEVTAEQAAKSACDKNCGECDELDLDDCREEMVYAVLDYLTALGMIPEEMEIDDDDIDSLIEIIKEVEEEYKAKISFMKMLAAMTKMEASKKEKEKEKVGDKKVTTKSSADDIIAQFLKGLH